MQVASPQLSMHGSSIFESMIWPLLAVLCQSIHLRQFKIQFASPELMRLALRERFTKRVDAFSSGMPCFVARIDRDTMIDEPGPNGAFHLIDATIERFSILDQ